MQDNKNVKINDLATMLCKFQSIIFFDDLFELSNAEIIKKCDLHFGYLDAYDVVARLYESKINKKLNKPCLATIDDYINRFSTVLYSTDEELWPQPNLTLETKTETFVGKTNLTYETEVLAGQPNLTYETEVQAG